MEIPEINLPDTDYLVPPSTIFYPPVAEVPFLDPILLPSLEQVQSGLGEDQESSSEEETSSSAEEVIPGGQPQVPSNLPKTIETLSTEEGIATFNLPFFGEMPIPAPEVIASSIIAAGTASVVSVAGGIAMQSVLAFIKKTSKKIFTKVLKKEVKDFQTKKD